MKRPELLSRIFVLVAVGGVVGTLLYIWARTPLIHARVAENGGWSPVVIQANVNEPLHLRLTSDDVVHGFAVGQMNMPGVDVLPGEVTELTLIFDKPGIYTFYCTRWCGLNHWRMRGTLEVGGSRSDPPPAPAPLYLTLGLDIDVAHEAAGVPEVRPSASNGQTLAANLPISQFSNPNYYRTSSPYQLFQSLEATQLNDSGKWDVVAYIWQSNTTRAALANGQKLYLQNCAACHGANGAGDGVFADQLKAVGESMAQTLAGAQNMTMQKPISFTDAKRMLGAPPALLQGKILRGGMGTGMPSWGPIFTEDQTWDLVAYLYSFQFKYFH